MKKVRFNSYQYCRICGYQPKSESDRPTSEVVRYWDPDDGWRFGHLCPWCYEDVKDDQPKPTDYAYHLAKEAGEIDTDEDIMGAI